MPRALSFRQSGMTFTVRVSHRVQTKHGAVWTAACIGHMMDRYLWKPRFYMLQGDQSNAPLFIAGCGVAALAIALTQGWMHKEFVGFLFLLSVVLVSCALSWGYFETGVPQIASKVSTVADQSISWFVLLIVAFGAISILDVSGGIGWFGGHRKPRRRKPEKEDDL
jgi:hypothetical protein